MEVKQIKAFFMEMGIDVSEQIYQSSIAFLDQDYDLAHQIIDGDVKINAEEVQLEKMVFKTLHFQKTDEADFRLLMSVLKASSDLERMGDYAVHIAKQALRLRDKPHVEEAEKIIVAMTAKVRSMLEGILDAYLNEDAQSAYRIAGEDLEVDRFYLKMHRLTFSRLADDLLELKANDSYMMVSRMLERVGDHIVNLAEWIVYSRTGRIVELNPGKTDPALVRKG